MNSNYCEREKVHLTVCHWESLAKLFKFFPVLLTSRIYSDAHWDTIFLILFHHTIECSPTICIGYLGNMV